ncbi:MAG: CCA tRNA nucleotidyltransferase, partial [Patescibacteria group bacterium]|nr:CCA tRNA nucleotidyltransferase [Patescibacteria group bacterium]
MNDLTTHIPQTVLEIDANFRKAGFEVYLVGGSVRDILLGKQSKDWDFTTNATPEEILNLFPNGFYDNVFGTVGIPAVINNEDGVIEVTTYRTEREYKDGRHPTNVS